MSRPLRLGTRRSALATTQSGWVADRLRELGLEVEIVEVITEGDVNMAPLTQIGGTGVFASALRGRLVEGSVDFAVHSLKDLPVAAYPGLVIAAVPEREDVRDVLISRDGLSLAALPASATVGTGSPRRAAQLRQARPDLRITAIRGNVGTRIGKVTGGELDAVVLAGAGVRRLGLTEQIAEYLPLDLMLPAAGQGALAVECRSDDTEVREAIAQLDHADTRLRITAERTLLATLEAGCTAPIGAHASVHTAREVADLLGISAPSDGERHVVMEAFVGTATGGVRLRRTAPVSDADRLGVDMGMELRERVLAAGGPADLDV